MGQDLNSYIAIDLETSGLRAKIDKIIEIAALRVVDGTVTDTFETLINPHRIVPEAITALTGIASGMLLDAPEIEEVIEAVVEFSEGLPLLGHHVIFDYSFLKKAAVNKRLHFEKRGIDTLKLCRKVMPEAEKKSLDAACRFFQIPRSGAHRAYHDAADAHRLYQCLRGAMTSDHAEWLMAEPLIYKVKRDQPASKKQKEDLRELIKYHKIEVLAGINHLSRNEISRLTDYIILHHGRIGSK